MSTSESRPTSAPSIAPPPHPEELNLFYDPPGTLRLTAGDRSYPGVKLFQSWPLTHPNQYLTLLDGRGEEIVMIPDLTSLSVSSRVVAEEELRRRYLTSRIERVIAVRSEFGVTYWDVVTDRGPRDFVLTSISEATQWLSPDHVLITDVSGNRFELVSISTLDQESRTLLDTVL